MRMTIRPQVVNLLIRYGAILLFAIALVDVYCVMRYFELRRTSVKAEESFQQFALRRQALEGVLREFAARASTDATIMQILQRAQSTTNQQPSAFTPSAPKAP